MMGRLLKLVFIAGLTAILASWLSQQEGVSRLDWLGYRIEIQTSWLAAIFLVFCVALVFTDRLWRALRHWPSVITTGWRERRRQRGERALALGMVALAAGDGKAARKQAKRSEKLLGRGMLPDLLAAQAAHANGDTKAAQRYFTDLSKEEDTAYYGQIGLMNLHDGFKDDKNSKKAAQKALALNPKAGAPAAHLRIYALKDKDWKTAYDLGRVLMQSNDQLAQNSDALSYQQAVIAFLQATEMMSQVDTTGQEMIWLEKAIADAPHLLPAVQLLAKAEATYGRTKKAVTLLEKTFQLAPHALILDDLQRLSGDNEGQFIARLIKLAKSSKQRVEASYVIARTALNAGIWASASAQLADIPVSEQRSDYFEMMAELAHHKEDEKAQFEAMQQAARAPRGPSWQCTNCETILPQFEPICPSCAEVGQISWTRSNARTLALSIEHMDDDAHPSEALPKKAE